MITLPRPTRQVVHQATREVVRRLPALPEPVGELLAVVGEHLLRHSERRQRAANARHTARPVARSTTAAITQNREWSSTPVTTLASRSAPVTGSTSITPPTMSSCHNCIGPGRCQRVI